MGKATSVPGDFIRDGVFFEEDEHRGLEKQIAASHQFREPALW